jgi:superfamily II DNA/RNA helicase
VTLLKNTFLHLLDGTRMINAFKVGQLRMLIATDVAACGLDVKDVGIVINYDMSHGVNGVEDYVHRIR